MNRVLLNQLPDDVLNLVAYRLRCKHYFCHLTRPPSYRQSSFRIPTLGRYLRNAGKVGCVGGYSPGQCTEYCMTQLLLRVQKPISLTLQRPCRFLMFRTERRYFRKSVGGRSDSVQCLLVPYLFSSRCVWYVHDAIFIFSCRLCRYDLCVRFL